MEKLSGFKAKCRGYDHIESNTVCQDAVGYFCNNEKKYAICVDSDGHGSEKYFRSDIGSEKIVEISIRAIKEFMESDLIGDILSEANSQKILTDLASHIVSRWIDELESHWNSFPPDEREKELLDKYFSAASLNITKIYGVTLTIGVMSEHFSFVMQCGDGAACVIKENGDASIPHDLIDERQYAGYTNSLSSSNCIQLFRYFYTEKLIKAIIVASDGVLNSYGENDGKDFLNFCKKLLDIFMGDYAQSQNHLEEWLPKLSELGSKDDMSVAGIFQASSMDEINSLDTQNDLDDGKDENDKSLNNFDTEIVHGLTVKQMHQSYSQIR